jgi:hypothetical protein
MANRAPALPAGALVVMAGAVVAMAGAVVDLVVRSVAARGLPLSDAHPEAHMLDQPWPGGERPRARRPPPAHAAMVTAAFAAVEAPSRALALELGPVRVMG